MLLCLLAIGLLLLWGAWTNRLKRPLLIVGILMVVQSLIPVASYGMDRIVIWPLVISITIGITFIIGAWKDQIRWSLAIVGSLLVVQALLMLVMAPHEYAYIVIYFLIGIALVVGVLTNHIKWPLITVGAVVSIWSLLAMVVTSLLALTIGSA